MDPTMDENPVGNEDTLVTDHQGVSRLLIPSRDAAARVALVMLA